MKIVEMNEESDAISHCIYSIRFTNIRFRLIMQISVTSYERQNNGPITKLNTSVTLLVTN